MQPKFFPSPRPPSTELRTGSPSREREIYLEAFVKRIFIFLLVFSLSIPAFAAAPPASSGQEAPKDEKIKEEKGKNEKAGDEREEKGSNFPR